MDKEIFEKLVERICQKCSKTECKLLENITIKQLKNFTSIRKCNSYNIEKRTSFNLGEKVIVYFVQLLKPVSEEIVYLAILAEDDVELSSYKATTLEDSKPFFKIFDYAYRDAKRIVENFIKGE